MLAAGLAHRPAVDASRAEFHAQSMAVREYVAARAPAYAHGLDAATTLRLEASLYRTCVPSARPDRALCLFVHTDENPPGVQLDPNRAPNRTYTPTPGG